jgi:hypothetical protein
MGTSPPLTNHGARHFDRGFSLAFLGLVSLSLAACSTSPTNLDPGTGGVGGTGINSNLCGSTGAAGNFQAGVGGSTSSGGIGGGGTGAGTGGTMSAPTCAADGTVTFGVCFVNSADVLPPPVTDGGNSTSGSATIENVGIGRAPASCEDARWYGARGTSEWWFQARAADNRLWTFGVRGLGVPLVRKNDTVTLNHAWSGYSASSASNPTGRLELSDAAGTPLLWAGATLSQASTGWLQFSAADDVCQRAFGSCQYIRENVTITVNGSVTTVAPFGAACLGGYYIAVGEAATLVTHNEPCGYDNPGPPFATGAVKVQ